MTIKLLVDMNLSPGWVPFLVEHGVPAAHWSSVGDPREADAALMEWARVNEHVVFTNDLDFGTTLALTHSSGPSVIQVRTADLLPDRVGDLVVATLLQHEQALASGALIVVDERRARVRILPLH